VKKLLLSLAITATMIVSASAEWIAPGIAWGINLGGSNCMQHAREALDAAGFPATKGAPPRTNAVYGAHGEYSAVIVCNRGEALFFIGGNNEMDVVNDTLGSIGKQFNEIK
jgi:hypothetical protein